MVVTDSETACGISGSSSRPVTKSKNPADTQGANRFHDCVGGRFRRLEMHGDGLVTPGILQLMAAIRDVDKLDAEFARDFFKTSRLVTEFRGEEQQTFGWMSHWRTTLFMKSGPPRKAGPPKTRKARLHAGIKQNHRRWRRHFSPVAFERRWKPTGPGSARRSNTTVR